MGRWFPGGNGEDLACGFDRSLVDCLHDSDFPVDPAWGGGSRQDNAWKSILRPWST